MISYFSFKQIKKHKTAYFMDFWNILDLVLILLCGVCIGFNIYRFVVRLFNMILILEIL